MANDQTFSYRLVKISLVILNSLVIIGLTFSLLLIGHHFDSAVIVFVLIIESNFVAAIVGAIRESRPLVLTTGSVTLILLLLAVFNRNERTQNSTFSLLYFLAIVMLSFAFSAMLKERQQNRLRTGGRPQEVNGQHSLDPNSTPFTTVVVYQSSTPAANATHVNLPIITPTPTDQEFKDPPPPYEDCPPPKYEEVADIPK